MADIKVFRLMAAGPATLLEAVESDSVEISSGEDLEEVMGQRLTPIDYFVKSVSKPIGFSQAYVGYSGLSVEAAFGLYWQALADTGGLGAGGKSVVGKFLIIPQAVRCTKGSTAKTTLRLVAMDAEPTVGTTTVTPAGATHQYMNGPSTFNGSALDGIIEQDFSFGLSVQTNVAFGGKLRPTAYWIVEQKPVMRIRTTDLGIVSSYLTGAKIASAACVMKFMNETGSAGYQYSMTAARVQGDIRNNIGTLTLSALHDTTICAGATY